MTRTGYGLVVSAVGIIVGIIGSHQAIAWIRLSGASLMALGFILWAPAWLRARQKALDDLRRRYE